MLAGGLGNIRTDHIKKGEIPVGAKLIVLGGPAMNIGLGGGAASSMTSGQSAEDLDFASVQRDNPEMERRAQEVIDRCWQMGEENPILFIHDRITSYNVCYTKLLRFPFQPRYPLEPLGGRWRGHLLFQAEPGHRWRAHLCRCP